MGYIYALLSIAAVSVLGISYKLSDRLECDKRQVNFFFLFFGLLVSIVWWLTLGRLAAKPDAVWLGSAMGVVVFIAVIIFREAMSKGRISTSWTILNLALVVPVLASVFVWHEIPKPKHVLGLAMTIIAIVLLGIDIGRSGE